MSLIEASVSDAAARTPQGQFRGAMRSNGVDTTAHSFDVTAWSGRIIWVTVTGRADYRFAETTGASLDVSTEHLVASTAHTTGAAIADILPAAGKWPITVPLANGTGNAATGRIFLRIAADDGTIDVAVIPG
jgi:hypothetical protein